MSTVEQITSALAAGTFTYVDEVDFHRGIDTALTAAGIDFTPEVRLNSRDRIDYLIGTVGVEVKIKGTTDALRRQITRYADSPLVDELLVITTRPRHMDLHRKVLAGKPVTVLAIGRLS